MMRPPEKFGPDLAVPVSSGDKTLLLSLQAKLSLSEMAPRVVAEAGEKSSLFCRIDVLSGEKERLIDSDKIVPKIQPPKKGGSSTSRSSLCQPKK